MSTVDPTKFYSKEALEAELLKKAREDAEKLWQTSEKSRRLANLHQELGYRSTADLIAALRQIGGAAEPKAKKEGRRTRTTITDGIRAKVKELAAQGKKAPTIAKEVGLSAPTVYKLLA